MNCKNCKYASWKRTSAGRLHPSGEGKCTCPIKMPTLPKAFSWAPYAKDPHPSGGWISRRELHLTEGCQRYQPND